MSEQFVPLSTTQGMTVRELRAFVAHRDVIIWGGGHLGRIIMLAIEKYGLVVKAFCDSNPSLQGKVVNGINIIAPKFALENSKNGNVALVIASSQYRDEIQAQCISSGLQVKIDYLLYLHISRPEAIIDISENCDKTNRFSPKVMALDTYKKVINKLLLELPLLSHISLSAWGDPLLNPDLPKIIELTEKNVPCTVTTNLYSTHFLREVIKAEPSQFVVSVHYYGEEQEEGFQSVDMNILKANLHVLSKLIKETTPSTDFKVMYHIYKHNQEEELKNIAIFCSDLGLKLVTAIAYLNPYEQILSYSRGEELTLDAEKTRQQLAWDIDRALELSKKDRSFPCLCQRIFPIINWDLSVSLCEIYYGPKIALNFIEIQMRDLLGLRYKELHCRECQSYSLHRLDIDILHRRHPDEKIFLKNEI